MIVISGISSAIGMRTASFLVQKGYQVRGFARNINEVRKHLDHPMIELVSGDLLDRKFVHSVCNGAHGVIHLAARSSPWGKFNDFYLANVEGTKSIVEAAKKCHLNRMVHVSTPSLYFDFRDRYDICENEDLPLKGVNAYAVTKKMAENVVDNFVESGGSAITLRPRAVFGPYDRTLFPRVLKVCKEKGIPKFKRKSPIIDVTYVDNLAYALCLALEAPSSCIGQKYNITNGEPIALWELLNNLLKRLSIPIHHRYFPYSIAYSAALIAEWKSLITKQEPRFTRYSLGVMSFSQTLSIEKAKNELKYNPITSLKEGIDRYVNWIQTS